MVNVSRHRRQLFVLSLLALYAVELLIVRQAAFVESRPPWLAWVPVIDLLVVPLALYALFFGWKRLVALSDATPLVALFVSLVLLRFALPPALRLPSLWLEGGFIALEVVFLLRVASQVGRIRSAYRLYRDQGEGIYESLSFAFHNTLPRAFAHYVNRHGSDSP